MEFHTRVLLFTRPHPRRGTPCCDTEILLYAVDTFPRTEKLYYIRRILLPTTVKPLRFRWFSMRFITETETDHWPTDISNYGLHTVQQHGYLTFITFVVSEVIYNYCNYNINSFYVFLL